MTSSRVAHPLQRVLVDLAGPRKITSAGWALYLILFKADVTRMGWLYPLRSKSAADVASTTKKFLADVVGGVKCFRTDNGTEFVYEIFVRLCSDQTIPHEHTGVDGPKDNGVAERGLGLIQERDMAACLQIPRVFTRQFPNFDRYRVEAAILHERLPEGHGDHGECPLQVAKRDVYWGDYHRQTPSPSCSPDFAACTAPTSRSQGPSGAPVSTGGRIIRETA